MIPGAFSPRVTGSMQDVLNVLRAHILLVCICSAALGSQMFSLGCDYPYGTKQTPISFEALLEQVR